MSIKAARIETKQTLMTLTWSHQKTPLIFKMTRFVLCISFGEIIPNLTIEWYAQPATRSFEISGPICPSDQDLASTKIVCFQNMGDYTHQAAKMVEQKKNPSQKTGVNSGSGGQKCLTQVVGIYKDEGFTKVYECDPHKIFEWSCCCCLVCSFGGGWGEGRLEWSLLEVEVPPSKDESLVKDMAIIEELSQQICWSSIFFFFEIFWASYFDWHGKKPPKPKPNHPKLDWNQPPKIHPQKSNQPYPQTEATFQFHPFPTTLFFVRSTRWSPWMNHSSRRRPRRFALRTLPLGRNVGTAVEGGSFLVGEVTEQLVDWLVDLLMLVCLILLK